MRTYYRRNNQPHIQPIGGTFSITLMVHDAVPQAAINALRKERNNRISQSKENGAPLSAIEKTLIHTWFEQEQEGLLHQKRQQENPFQYGQAAIAFMNRVLLYHKKDYTLGAMIVMHNHAHLLLDLSIQLGAHEQPSKIPEGYLTLDKIIGRLKGGSAYDVNRILERKHSLWGKGYYDRFIRSEKHLRQAFWYILRNAKQAGIVEEWQEYPYVYANQRWLEELKWEKRS